MFYPKFQVKDRVPANAFTERQDDERILRILAARRDGQTLAGIAAAEGMSRSAVAGLIHRIKSADLAESGEPAPRIEVGYRHG